MQQTGWQVALISWKEVNEGYQLLTNTLRSRFGFVGLFYWEQLATEYVDSCKCMYDRGAITP